MDSIDKFQLNHFEKRYYQQQKCFDLCVTNFRERLLDSNQKNCLNQCFNKMSQIQKIYLDKLKEGMEYLVMNDPSLKRNFQLSKAKSK